MVDYRHFRFLHHVWKHL